MEFRDLKLQYQNLKLKVDQAILQVTQDCNFISGAQVTQLEKELAEYVGTKHCISCANGTDALSLALMAWGYGDGDAVFVPDFTFFSSGECVSLVGATPVFVDVDKDTFNIDPIQLEKQIDKVLRDGKLTPRCIIAVDLFGLPANFSSLKILADKYDLKILEDGAQGFGGVVDGKKACSFGDISTTSFFPAKPLGCYGDGGAVFTNDDEVANSIKSIRIHGKGENKYDNVRIGMNSRLDTIQAAILLIKLQAFKDDELSAVNMVAKKYSKRLEGLVKIPVVPEGFYSSWAQYTIRLGSKEERDDLQHALGAKGIPSMIYYQRPMHKQQAFDEKLYDDKDFLSTIELCETVLSLPMHPYLSDCDIDIICSAIEEQL